MKKGDISLNYVVIAAIALVVLVVIIIFFMGGLQTLFQRQKETVGSATEQQLEIWRGQCKLYCSLGQKENFKSHVFEITTKEGITVGPYVCNTGILNSGVEGKNLNVECPEFLKHEEKK